jgi:hypothetical protein
MLSLKRHIEGRNRHPGSLSRHLINASKHSAFKKEMFFLPGYQPPSILNENVMPSSSSQIPSSQLPLSMSPTISTLPDPFNAIPTTAGSPLPVPSILSTLVAPTINPTESTTSSMNVSTQSPTTITTTSNNTDLMMNVQTSSQPSDEQQQQQQQQRIIWKTEDEGQPYCVLCCFLVDLWNVLKIVTDDCQFQQKTKKTQNIDFRVDESVQQS